MARTVEDVLARRTRALVLNAAAARAAAPLVAALLARELGRDAAWAAAQVRSFRELADRSIRVDAPETLATGSQPRSGWS
jgi:glycerol-3-phosphate dehydrogenase